MTLLSWGEASFLQREKHSSQVAVGRGEPAPAEPRWGAAEAGGGDCIRICRKESSPQQLLEEAGAWALERVTVLGYITNQAQSPCRCVPGMQAHQVRACTDVCRMSLLGLLRVLWLSKANPGDQISRPLARTDSNPKPKKVASCQRRNRCNERQVAFSTEEAQKMRKEDPGQSGLWVRLLTGLLLPYVGGGEAWVTLAASLKSPYVLHLCGSKFVPVTKDAW